MSIEMPAVASETSLEMPFLHILAILHIAAFFSLFFEAKQKASAWKLWVLHTYPALLSVFL